jgi:hypothetical protein
VTTVAEAAAELRRIELSPFDKKFNKAADRIVGWIEKWIVNPLLGTGQSAID